MKVSSYQSSVRPSKFIPALLLVICLAISFTGCSFSVDMPVEEEREIEPIPEGSPAVSQQTDPGPQQKPSAQTADEQDVDFPDSYADDADAGTEDEYEVESTEGSLESTGLDGYTDEEINSAAAVNVGRFAYERLDKNGKRVYNEIYLTIRDMRGEYELDCENVDDINRFFLCVMMDHPEIFWVSGYVYTRYTRGDVLEAMGFKGAYTLDPETVTSRQASIDAYVDTCLAGVPQADDYARIKYIYEYVIRNTDYDPSAVDNQNICSVFINGRSVCQGYAKATQYLLNKTGIPCTLITGTAIGQGNHAWNLVFADGSYYYLDTTWGDANYRYAEGMSGTFPSISYDYLCVPGSEIFKTHTPDTPVDLPQCISMNDNYYVREGAYFTAVDEGRLNSLFATAREQGRDFVTVKASDASVYADLKRYLLEEQRVFSFIGTGEGTGSISYWENDNLYTISFNL